MKTSHHITTTIAVIAQQFYDIKQLFLSLLFGCCWSFCCRCHLKLEVSSELLNYQRWLVTGLLSIFPFVTVRPRLWSVLPSVIVLGGWLARYSYLSSTECEWWVAIWAMFVDNINIPYFSWSYLAPPFPPPFCLEYMYASLLRREK